MTKEDTVHYLSFAGGSLSRAPKMNSSNDLPAQEDCPSTSRSDSNANVSKGAIPKRRMPSKTKKSKFNTCNNNIEEPCNKEDLNGFGDRISRCNDRITRTSQGPLDYCSCIVCKHGMENYDQPGTSGYDPLNLPGLDCDTNSDDNELLSISDDGCIYTYKGDVAADLPNSFFNLDLLPPNTPDPSNRQENASPEMDYLEMDFDPGPSGDTFSDTQSNPELESEETQEDACTNSNTMNDNDKFEDSDNVDVVTNSNDKILTSETPVLEKPPAQTITKSIHKLIMPWSCSLPERTKCDKKSKKYRYSDRTSSNSEPSVSSEERTLVNLLKPIGFKRAMIWSEEEASREIKQIGTSACGATAVLNVLSALKYPLPSMEEVKETVPIRLRANDSPLTEYLLSRSVAGCTHEDLIDGVKRLTNGEVFGRFFHMYPEKVVNLPRWLHFWIGHGAVPVATLNLQKESDPIADSWHHQMIYGVSSEEIFLANPMEVIGSQQLWPQLCSESVLLIRRKDVLSRWNIRTDLKELMSIRDVRWRRINVVGQVVSLVRENRRPKRLGFTYTRHIKIPASYSAGITLFIRTDSSNYTFLKHCPELPLMPHDVDEEELSDTLY